MNFYGEKKDTVNKSVYKCLIAIIVVIFDVIIIATIIYFHSLSFRQRHMETFMILISWLLRKEKH